MNKFSFAAFASLALSSFASASIIPSLMSVTPNGSAFNFTYTAFLSADQRLDPAATANTTCAGNQLCSPAGLTPPSGTFFTIYDVNGFNGATTVPTSWTAFTLMVGQTPSLQSGVPDSSLVTNVSFFYNGPKLPASGPRPALGPTNLGNFVIGSIFGSQTVGYYTAQATKNTNDITDGTLTQNVGNVPIPGVPEPASMLLIGSGLVGLAAFRRKLFNR